jgi:hypothetical protein
LAATPQGAAEEGPELTVYDWPFRTIKKTEWYSIPQATRDMIEVQVKSLIPAHIDNRRSA